MSREEDEKQKQLYKEAMKEKEESDSFKYLCMVLAVIFLIGGIVLFVGGYQIIGVVCFVLSPIEIVLLFVVNNSTAQKIILGINLLLVVIGFAVQMLVM